MTGASTWTVPAASIKARAGESTLSRARAPQVENEAFHTVTAGPSSRGDAGGCCSDFAHLAIHDAISSDSTHASGTIIVPRRPSVQSIEPPRRRSSASRAASQPPQRKAHAHGCTAAARERGSRVPLSSQCPAYALEEAHNDPPTNPGNWCVNLRPALGLPPRPGAWPRQTGPRASAGLAVPTYAARGGIAKLKQLIT